jgi:hypothetical protein
MVLPELTQLEAGGSQALYNQQYIGSYAFRVRPYHHPSQPTTTNHHSVP